METPGQISPEIDSKANAWTRISAATGSHSGALGRVAGPQGYGMTQANAGIDRQIASTAPEALSSLGKRQSRSSIAAVERREWTVSARTILASAQSADLRDRMLAEIALLSSADEGANWAHRNLPLKNTLIAGDADLVEVGFRDKLAAFEASSAVEMHSRVADERVTAEIADNMTTDRAAPSTASTKPSSTEPTLPERILARRRELPVKTIRLRDKEHCKHVASQPCVVCGRAPSEAHHLRFAQPRALGRKVSDEYTVPVCRLHHRDLHRYGDEASWWAGVGIEPLPIALELWRRSRLTYSLDATGSEPLSDATTPCPPALPQASRPRDRTHITKQHGLDSASGGHAGSPLTERG